MFMNSKPMLNAYPDSLGGNLGNIVTLLKTEDLQDVFSSFYILPSLYHSDLDRGFSVIDYRNRHIFLKNHAKFALMNSYRSFTKTLTNILRKSAQKVT